MKSNVNGQFFLIDSSDPKIPTKIVVSADKQGLAELLAAFWHLLNSQKGVIQLSQLTGFEPINLADIIFVRGGDPQVLFDGSRVEMRVNQKILTRYAELVEALLKTSQGHQYLDAEPRGVNIGIMISIGEYSVAQIEKIRRGTSH